MKNVNKQKLLNIVLKHKIARWKNFALYWSFGIINE